MGLSIEFLRTISKEEVSSLPIRRYEGEILLVEDPRALERAAEDIHAEQVVGFDTETRPAFRVGESHLPALAQVATARAVYLFPLQRLDCSAVLAPMLAAQHIVKAGISMSDDLKKLKQLVAFEEAGILDLGHVARRHGMKQTGLRNLTGLLLGTRIPRREDHQLSTAALGPANHLCGNRCLGLPRALLEVRGALAALGLPHRVALFLQRDGELDFHVARRLVGHRVGVGVEPGQQPQAEALDVGVRADTRLVLGEAFLGGEAGHAHVHARLEHVAVGIGGPEAREIEHPWVELDDVDVVAMPAWRPLPRRWMAIDWLCELRLVIARASCTSLPGRSPPCHYRLDLEVPEFPAMAPSLNQALQTRL
jgi:hypothetical protein